MILEWLTEAQSAGARQRRACHELGLDPRTVQRWRRQGGGDDGRCGPRTVPANSLSVAERRRVLEIATSPDYRDKSPKQIVPLLADAGTYVASESTFYRILRAESLQHHRGRAKPPTSKAPLERIATGPALVWSWDITYLRSPVRGMFYYLYLFMDVWSRKIVGYEVHEVECTELASELLAKACTDEDITAPGLVVHSDNGNPMKGATLKATMERLGVISSLSRPHVSDDNPFSESLFRTLKYRPGYPAEAFADLSSARKWVADFVCWYNTEHLHSGIGFVTPSARHDGRANAILEARRKVYEAARHKTPSRWAKNTRRWDAPAVVVLNPSPETRLRMPSYEEAA